MFRNTKIDKRVAGLPIGETYSSERVFMTLFNKFGPWVSDSYQHVLVKSSVEDLGNYIANTYAEENSPVVPNLSVVTNKTLMSDGHKYVIPFKNEYFHYILNTLVVILDIYEHDPSAEFVVMLGNKDTSGYQWTEQERKKNLDFLDKILTSHKIPYIVLDSEHSSNSYELYVANNITVVNDFLTSRELTLREITGVINKYVLSLLNVDVIPGKKIYISRGGTVSEDSAFVEAGVPESGYKTNFVRMYGEPELEEYLESEGFEIFKFDNVGSLEDQIRTFASAELVVGATGTGLINVLFMKDGQNVIELKTEIKWLHGEHEANSHYMHFSYGKGHRYMFVDVADKQAKTAITQLKRLRWFLID